MNWAKSFNSQMCLFCTSTIFQLRLGLKDFFFFFCAQVQNEVDVRMRLPGDNHETGKKGKESESNVDSSSRS